MKKKLALLLAVLMAANVTNVTSIMAYAAEDPPQEYASPSEYVQSSPSEAEYIPVATPSEPEKLDAPTGVYWDNTTACWDAVDNAEGYYVQMKIFTSAGYFYGFEETIFESVDLENLIITVSDANNISGLSERINFKVMAIGDGEYRSSNYSEWSEYLDYEIGREQLDTPENLIVTDTTASWDVVNHASQYYIVYEIEEVGDDHFCDYPTTNSSNMISLFNSKARELNLANGDYTVRFKAQALGGNTGASAAYASSTESDWSETVTVHYGINVTKLDVPSNLVLGDDLTVTWDSVNNAYEYAVMYSVEDNNSVFNNGMVLTQDTTTNLEQYALENARYFNIDPQTLAVSCYIQARPRFDSSEYTASDYSSSTGKVNYQYTVEKETLGTPTNLTWNGGYAVSWDAVEHVGQYYVNYSIDGDNQWTVITTDTSINLERYIKENSVQKQLPAGDYEIKFRVKAVVAYDETKYMSGEYSDWSESATYTIYSVNTEAEDASLPATNPESEEEEETTTSEGTEKKTDISAPVKPASSSSSGYSSGSSGGGSGSGSAGGGAAVGESTVVVPTYVETTGTWSEDATTSTWTYSNNGEVYKDKWAAIQTGLTYAWFSFDSNGVMRTGWFTDKDGSVYYLNPGTTGVKGAMVTGTVIIDGVSYTFDASGRLIG